MTDVIAYQDNKIVQRLLNLGYIGVGSEELLKKEVSFAAGQRLEKGITGITMQISAGHGQDLVASDVQGLIFHKEMYNPQNNPTLRDELRKQVRGLEGELNDLKRGKISSRMREKITRGVNTDVSNWKNLRFKSRLSAERYRKDAIKLQQKLLMGEVKIQDIPDLMNTAANMLKKDVFDTDRQIDIITKKRIRPKCFS